MFVELVVLLAIAGFLLYRWAVANNDFFKERGVPYDKPFPLFGSMKDMVLRKSSMFDIFKKIYNQHDGKVYGIFDLRNPVFMIRDPELIKQICVKEFDHFINHLKFFPSTDDLFGNSLFAMDDGKWRDMRTTLTPVFTGSKMRQMFQLMNHVAQETAAYLKGMPGMDSEAGVEVDTKDVCSRYTNDIIASTAFGVQVNSFDDKNNQFFEMGKKLTNFTLWTNIKIFLFSYCPKVCKLLKMELFDKATSEYFTRLVVDAMKYRLEHNIIRPDMVHMLMEARGMIKSDNPKPHNREWSEMEIVAQCVLFFFAGFETTATMMCFLAQELMENPDVQQKLFEEVQATESELNDEPLSYDVLQRMKYMDMVLSETQRKWPNAIITDRVCNKDYVYEADGERIEFKKDDKIWIPLVGLHHDPKYYENPMVFDPERFSDTNKDNISPYTYLPFGLGPRSCIANRFALLEIKALMYYLVRNFRFEAGQKTSIPIELTKDFQMGSKNGFWLKLVARSP